jgi:hypothetical protein
MISQVLREIKKSGSTISLDELSRRLEIEASALEGMLEYCVRKGILRDSEEESSHGGGCNCDSGGCDSGSEGYEGCSFIAKMPKMYTLGEHEERGNHSV